MPKIRAFTPAWLSTDSPDGRSLFSASSSSSRGASLGAAANASPKKQQCIPGPRRTIARRGTEVFVANGREIRWADLVSMKGAWEPTQAAFSQDAESASPSKPAYRTLKPPVASDIRQLVMSPNANYMAIMTTHTVHICVLPDPSHLVASEDADVPLKTRYFTLGPTTHVTTRQPLVSALWHPLGVNGSAIVTVTRDAVVRLWEISHIDRWSFDAPSLSVDMKKLADGTWLDQDFGASVTTNTSYSPDLFDMEVAAACFGPRSSGGWSSMTLYVAMLGGDVYALCPLLPKRFAPPPALIPSLSVAVVSNLAAIEDDPTATTMAKLLARQQLDWMTQIDNQEPALVDSAYAAEPPGNEPPTEIFTRPAHPSIVPKLQGPLEVDLDEGSDDEDETTMGDLCDIFVIGEKVDTDFLAADDDDDDEEEEEVNYQDFVESADQEGLSLPVICLVTTTGKLHVCLDLVGVEAQWLPQRAHKSNLKASNNSALLLDDSIQSSARPLLTFQVIDVMRDAEKRPGTGWCTFSPDVTSRYSFFITHPGGITHVSLSSWVYRLEQELQETTDTGADFRIRQLVTGENTIRHRVYTHTRDETLATSTVMMDPDLGYFLLSATEHSPVAICFESPDVEDGALGSSFIINHDHHDHHHNNNNNSIYKGDDTTFLASTAEGAARERSTLEDAEDKAVLALDFWKARPPFEIPPELLTKSELSQAKNMLFSSRYQMLQHQEVRLSPATLSIFTNAHKLVGKETGRLNQAAAQMFTKLDDLPIHLREQVASAYSLKHRIDMIAGEDDVADTSPDGTPVTDDTRLRQRLQAAQTRHKELSERMERLRRTYNRASARPLSDKERVWSQEVQALEISLDKAAAATATPSPSPTPSGASPDANTNKSLVLSSSVAAASPSKTASDIGLRVKQVHDLWDSLSKQAEALVGASGSSGAGAGAAEDMRASTASPVSVSVSVLSGGGTGTSTPSPPASTTGSEFGGSVRGSVLPGSLSTPHHHLLKVPADVRKAKMAQVTKLLERETAMVEAVTERLERLGVGL